MHGGLARQLEKKLLVDENAGFLNNDTLSIKITMRVLKDSEFREYQSTRGKKDKGSWRSNMLRLPSLEIPLDTLLRLFPAASSEVLARHARGGVAGSSCLSVRAGETFEIVVAIKDHFGPFTDAVAEHMARELVLLPQDALDKQGEVRFSNETGVAAFPVMVKKTGQLTVSAAVIYKGTAQRIGSRGVDITVETGEIRLESLVAKDRAEVGEQIELVLQLGDSDVFGNPLRSALSLRDEDVLALVAGLNLEGSWGCDNAKQALQGTLQLMEPTVTGRNPTSITVQLALLDLQLTGRHTFQIKSLRNQVVATHVEVGAGLPHALRLVGQGRAQVLQQLRWSCSAQVLNQHGSVTAFSTSAFSAKLVSAGDGSGGKGHSWPLEVLVIERKEAVKGCSIADVHTATTVQELELSLAEADVPLCRGEYEVRAVVKAHRANPYMMQPPASKELCGSNGASASSKRTARKRARKQMSDSEEDVGDAVVPAMARRRAARLLDDSDEASDAAAGAAACGGGGGGPPRRRWVIVDDSDEEDADGIEGSEERREPQADKVELEPVKIVLDPPLDPAQWSAQDLAYSLRHEGLEVRGDVVTDEFDKEQTGRELIENGRDTLWLKDCLLRERRFANKEEKDIAVNELKRVVGSLIQKHTLASLGKGKFRSSVAKCISESDLSLDAEPFDRRGFSKSQHSVQLSMHFGADLCEFFLTGAACPPSSEGTMKGALSRSKYRSSRKGAWGCLKTPQA